MKPILIDTNAYAAFKRGDSEAVFIVQRAPLVAVNSVILGELLGGFALGLREEANRRELVSFLNSPRVVVLPLDRHTADNYAVVYSTLKKAGRPIPTNDMWIAASAIQHRLAIYSFDRHFRSVPGLQTGESVVELEFG
ncbi:MAG: type II toxin-antitoxin system VapC family toxin [Pirellulaceae bacterium]|nr:type II toxin-antitoxin system VapC family toxin [Pirellulaceae bacterium]